MPGIKEQPSPKPGASKTPVSLPASAKSVAVAAMLMLSTSGVFHVFFIIITFQKIYNVLCLFLT